MKHSRDFEPLGSLLSQWFSQRKPNPQESHFLPDGLCTTWARIAGPVLARYSQPVKLMGHILSIEVPSETWCQALMEQRPFLLHQLKLQLPKLSIRDIQFSAKNTP
ncbi:MAG: DUF721 domain-containing protein [Cystobacterineae bacterium]|nr:DUF721 domain-containing protein [Cystobacterineae bacterium]